MVAGGTGGRRPPKVPEVSLEDPLVKATRAELRRWVGQRVQLIVPAHTMPDVGPWDTDGVLVDVRHSLVVLRPLHGPNAGLEIRYPISTVQGFAPLERIDPSINRWEWADSAGRPGTEHPGSETGIEP